MSEMRSPMTDAEKDTVILLLNLLSHDLALVKNIARSAWDGDGRITEEERRRLAKLAQRYDVPS